jgi:hypothetical protein
VSTFNIDDIEKKYMQSMVDTGKPGMSDEDIRTLFFALRNYQKMAVYFGDIIAGTASWLVSVKSTSKSERRRQVHICQTAAGMLRSEYGGHERSRERGHVVTRLDEVVKDAG